LTTQVGPSPWKARLVRRRKLIFDAVIVLLVVWLGWLLLSAPTFTYFNSKEECQCQPIIGRLDGHPLWGTGSSEDLETADGRAVEKHGEYDVQAERAEAVRSHETDMIVSSCQDARANRQTEAIAVMISVVIAVVLRLSLSRSSRQEGRPALPWKAALFRRRRLIVDAAAGLAVLWLGWLLLSAPTFAYLETGETNRCEPIIGHVVGYGLQGSETKEAGQIVDGMIDSHYTGRTIHNADEHDAWVAAIEAARGHGANMVAASCQDARANRQTEASIAMMAIVIAVVLRLHLTRINEKTDRHAEPGGTDDQD